MNKPFMRFPKGRKKAATFSYDDGHQCDIRFIDLLNKYGLKGTFNLNMGLAPHKGYARLTHDQFSCYEGHEVATHGYTHPFFTRLSPDRVSYEIMKDRLEMEQHFGRIIRGHAYSYGDFDEKSVQILRNSGICYARTTKATLGYSLPEDFLKWHPTCHHKEEKLFELINYFHAWNPSADSNVLYIWGHTSEFESCNERNNWDYAEEMCAKVAGHEDTVWYATNLEICDYVNAYKQLVFSMDGTLVYNPTCTDLWIGEFSKEESVKIPAGATINI